MRKIALVTLYDQSCPGLRYVASSLKAQGHDVTIVHFKRQILVEIPRSEEASRPELKQGYDWVYAITPAFNAHMPFPSLVTEREKEIFVQYVKDQGFEIVGFTLMTIFVKLARELTLLLRERVPQAKVVWGGLHAWFEQESSLECAHAVCVGEGEQAMAEFAADPNRTDVHNLWFNAGGSIVRNPLRPLLEDLDELPFPYYGPDEFIVEYDRIERVPLDTQPAFFDDFYFIASQRGCPNNCHYCTQPARKRVYAGQRYRRRRSAQNVIAELEYQVPRLKLKTIRIMDDVFMIDSKWHEEFCALYASRIGHPFGSYGYPVRGAEEMLKLSRQAGQGYLHLGIQSGSPYVSEEIFNRRYDRRAMADFAHFVDGLGLEIIYDLLGNNPFENEGHMRETLDYLAILPKAAQIYVFSLAFFPGVELNTLDKPRYDEVPRELRLLYAVLWYASRHKELNREMLFAMADNPVYRQDPEQIARILAIMLKEQEANRVLRIEKQNVEDLWRGHSCRKAVLGRMKGRIKRLVGLE